ncbi:MAG: shikimate kinase [Trueperaceae bacterium]
MARRHLTERPVTWVAMAGFMGAGKSRIGWELSRRLQLTFVDTDRVIERVACMRISEIFELYGEQTFRDYETEIVRRCLNLDEVVVSTGGGTVVREENRRLLRSRGPVVVLEASAETVYKRTRRHKRPLLESAEPLARIRELMTSRAPFYDDAASLKVNSDGREAADVVDDIVEGLATWAETHADDRGTRPGGTGPLGLSAQDLASPEPEPVLPDDETYGGAAEGADGFRLRYGPERR